MAETRTPLEIARRRIAWFKEGNPNTADPQWRDVFPGDDEDDVGLSPDADVLMLSGLGLREVPPEVFELEGVGTLLLGNQPLQVLPPEIGRLEGLESLDLTYTQVERLPDALFGLPGLRELYLQGSAIKSLPDSFKQARLEFLTLDDTELERFPDLSGVDSSLKSLTLEGFKGQALPAGVLTIKGLRQLDCSRSALRSLPLEIGRLRELVQLKIQKCKLTSLPRSIADIAFEEVFAAHRERALARGADPEKLPPVPSLYGIHLSGNPFKDKELRRIAKIKETEARTLAVQAWCRAFGDS